MKAMKRIKTVAGVGATLLLALGVAGCAWSGDKPRVRVVEEKGHIQLHHVRDTSQPLDLKKGDVTAMVCTKCKTVWYQPVVSPSAWHPYSVRMGTSGYRAWLEQRQALEDWSRRHYCPGCKSTITISGTWLNRKETVKHVCEACGEASVFCCATSKEAPPTEGMEPKSKP